MKANSRLSSCATIKLLQVLVLVLRPPRTGAKRRRHLLHVSGGSGRPSSSAATRQVRQRGRKLPAGLHYVCEQRRTLPLVAVTGMASPTPLNRIPLLTSSILFSPTVWWVVWCSRCGRSLCACAFIDVWWRIAAPFFFPLFLFLSFFIAFLFDVPDIYFSFGVFFFSRLIRDADTCDG